MWERSTSATRQTPSFMVTASGWAPPMPPSPPATVSRPATAPPKPWGGRSAGGLSSERGGGARGGGRVCPLENALVANVDPRAGGHLAVHGEAEPLQAAELVRGGPVGDEQRVGDQHPGGLRVGPE